MSAHLNTQTKQQHTLTRSQQRLMRRVVLPVLLLLIAAVLLSGCGGDSNSSGGKDEQGVKSAYKSLLANVKAGKYTEACAQFDAATRNALKPVGGCEKLIARDAAKAPSPNVADNLKVVIKGDRAVFTDPTSKKNSGTAVWTNGKWMFAIAN